MLKFRILLLRLLHDCVHDGGDDVHAHVLPHDDVLDYRRLLHGDGVHLYGHDYVHGYVRVHLRRVLLALIL